MMLYDILQGWIVLIVGIGMPLGLLLLFFWLGDKVRCKYGEVAGYIYIVVFILLLLLLISAILIGTAHMKGVSAA